MRRLTLVLSTFVCVLMYSEIKYSPDMLPLIIEDIYSSLTEDGRDVDFEELETDLMQLHENPINLNAATEEDLRKLRFLGDEQIDDILLFAYRHPFLDIYDLRMIYGLADYEIRNMIPFIYIAPVEKPQPFYWKEMWHYARHEVDLRLDARNIENKGKDPFYTSVKYRFQYKNKVDAGLVMERDNGEPFYVKGKTYGADFYGGWLQIEDVWKFKKISLGDYRVSFGQGLVLNTNMNYGGKAEYLLHKGFKDGGLQRKSSSAEYDFLRGAGATLNFGKVYLTALYSARKLDGNVKDGVFSSVLKTGYHRTENELHNKRSVWQQVAGINLTVKLRYARLGITASENILGDTLRSNPNYYNQNFFQGKRQFSAGFNYKWFIRNCYLFGEIATAQNTTWGLANITGLRYTPTNGVSLSAIYRYYSRYYDNMLASALSESSRLNDEQGAYIGFDLTNIRRLRIAGYVDFFYFKYPKYRINYNPSYGFDTYLTFEFRPKEEIKMQWSYKGKIKGDKSKYSLRYTLDAQAGNWIFRTCLEGNLAKQKTVSPTFGGLVYQQVEYHASRVPLVVQGRVEGFYAVDYDNRFFAYENDVLYAFSIPQMYGSGGRWFLNFRYQITKNVSIYLKASQSIFSDETMEKQSLTSRTRTEVHSMLRLKF